MTEEFQEFWLPGARKGRENERMREREEQEEEVEEEVVEEVVAARQYYCPTCNECNALNKNEL